MAHPTISVMFEQDHDRLDRLFHTFREKKRSDLEAAKEAFKEFKFGLQRHIVWEEEILFPAWEEKTGISEGGPTMVMRREHRQIGDALEAIHAKVQAQNPESDPEEQTLLNLLGAHNVKEERILYPAIDQVTTEEERGEMYRSMEALPEDRYRVCCGTDEEAQS